MPVSVTYRNKKYRVVESSTGKIAKNKSGTAVDGGGHTSKAKATKQAQAININKARKEGAHIPQKR